MTTNQFRNLLAFLCTLSATDVTRLSAPDYLIEKFARYAGVGTLRDDDSWMVGLHPINRAKFDTYVEHWKLHIEGIEQQEVAPS